MDTITREDGEEVPIESSGRGTSVERNDRGKERCNVNTVADEECE